MFLNMKSLLHFVIFFILNNFHKKDQSHRCTVSEDMLLLAYSSARSSIVVQKLFKHKNVSAAFKHKCASQVTYSKSINFTAPEMEFTPRQRKKVMMITSRTPPGDVISCFNPSVFMLNFVGVCFHKEGKLTNAIRILVQRQKPYKWILLHINK